MLVLKSFYSKTLDPVPVFKKNMIYLQQLLMVMLAWTHIFTQVIQLCLPISNLQVATQKERIQRFNLRYES